MLRPSSSMPISLSATALACIAATGRAIVKTACRTFRIQMRRCLAVIVFFLAVVATAPTNEVRAACTEVKAAPEVGPGAEPWVYEVERQAGASWPKLYTQLGLMFETGSGVTANAETAARFYRHAVDLGDSLYAPSLLIRLYGLGTGVAFSPAMADHLAREYIVRNPFGDSLGRILESREKALRPFLDENWIPKRRLNAAEAWVNERLAWDEARQLALSDAYRTGDGVPRSDFLAEYWLAAAARGSNGDASVRYARCVIAGACQREFPRYNSVYLVEISMVTAATAGYGPAKTVLAREYLSGQFLEQDTAKAYVWLVLAQEPGASNIGELRSLGRRLTVEQRAQALEWIAEREWWPYTQSPRYEPPGEGSE